MPTPTFYATPEIGSTFLTDIRPPDLAGTVRLLNFAADSDVNNEAGGDPTAYYTPDVPALQRLADKAAAQGNYFAWSAENGGAAAPGVRYALDGDGVSNSGSWLHDQAGALTRIAFHAGVLDIIRARQGGLKIGLQFGVPASSTPAAAASNGTAYSDLLDAEAAAGLPSKVDYLIVTAFAGTADQAAWRAQVDFDASTIAARYPGRQTLLMVNHTIGADNGSNYDASFWRYQLDTAAAKGWDVLLYNLGGPRAAEAWAVVREYAGNDMSLAADLADAVRDALNAGSFSKDFAAVRVWLPRVSLKDDLTPGVTIVKVVPTIDDRSVSTRTGIGRDIPIQVGIHAKLPDGTDPSGEAANAYIDDLVTFVEELAESLKPGAKFLGRVIVGTQIDPVCSVEQLAQNSVFLSVLTVAFKIV